jgi:hypothetical protein
VQLGRGDGDEAAGDDAAQAHHHRLGVAELGQKAAEGIDMTP